MHFLHSKHAFVAFGFQYLLSKTYSYDFDELVNFYLDTDKETIQVELHL